MSTKPGEVHIIVILLLRNEITQLFRLIKKVKAGAVEAEFEREVKELTAVVDSSAPQFKSSPVSAEQEFLMKLAEVSPRSAILEAWRRVESAIFNAVDQNEISVPVVGAKSPYTAIRVLTKLGYISNEDLALYHDLRALRNQAAHREEFDPNLEAALSYIHLSLKLEKAVSQHNE